MPKLSGLYLVLRGESRAERACARLSIFVSAIILCGCSTDYLAKPVSDPSMEVTYFQGQPVMISNRPSGPVSVSWMASDHDRDSRRLQFAVHVQNNTNSNLNFGIENIRVTDSKGMASHVWSADELVKEADRTASGQKAAVLLGAVVGVAASLAASESTTTSTYRTPSGVVSATSRTTNPAVAVGGSAASLGAAGVGVVGINAARDQRVDTIENNYVRMTTVGPGQQYAGAFLADLPKGAYPQNVRLTVQWGSETRDFSFIVQKQ